MPQLPRRLPHPRALLPALVAAALLAIIAPARAAEHLSFGLDWKAEAEYGGFYQALATGLYAKQGLDVTLREGGPQINQAQLLLAGRLDLAISSNSFLALNFVQEKLPFRAVAAIFQKDPAVLIAHPGQGNDSFAALKGKPIMISAGTRASWWAFLKTKFGYSDSQIRPYTFNLAPFLADKQAVQQGYLGSEPFSIEQATGVKPVVLLLADAGFRGYGSLISASDALIAAHPDRIARFLAASRAGWKSFLYGDPGPADRLIMKTNPEMTAALLAYGRNALIQNGIVDSGDARKLGIGAMTNQRWKDFVTSIAPEHLYPATIDYRRAYTLRFVGPAAKDSR